MATSIEKLFKENEDMLSYLQSKQRIEPSQLSKSQNISKPFDLPQFFVPEKIEMKAQLIQLQEHLNYLKNKDLQRQKKYDSLYNKYNFIMQLYLELLNFINENANAKILLQDARFNNMIKQFYQFSENEGNFIEKTPMIQDNGIQIRNMNNVLGLASNKLQESTQRQLSGSTAQQTPPKQRSKRVPIPSTTTDTNQNSRRPYSSPRIFDDLPQSYRKENDLYEKVKEHVYQNPIPLIQSIEIKKSAFRQKIT